MVADGRLLDLIRRIYCFGMTLLKLDVRQESTRHADALDAITAYLGYGSYKGWDEARKLEWLTAELATKRPLVPADMPMSDEVRRGAERGGQGRGGWEGVRGEGVRGEGERQGCIDVPSSYKPKLTPSLTRCNHRTTPLSASPYPLQTVTNKGARGA